MRKSHLEQFVESYLKRSNNKSLPRVYVEKAIALIDLKINNPCCDDSDAVIDLVTTRDNQLTIGVREILKNVKRQGNIKSYLKAKEKLEHFIGIGCCSQ